MNEIDLSQFDDDFADAEIEKIDNEEPPDGKYQVAVEKVELAKAKTSGNTLLKWQLRIIGPRCRGRCLFRNNVIATAENVKWLKKDLDAAGMEVSGMKLSDLPDRLKELLDVTLEVQKKTNGEYTNVYINRRLDIDIPEGVYPGGQQSGSGGGSTFQPEEGDDLPF